VEEERAMGEGKRSGWREKKKVKRDRGRRRKKD